MKQPLQTMENSPVRSMLAPKLSKMLLLFCVSSILVHIGTVWGKDNARSPALASNDYHELPKRGDVSPLGWVLWDTRSGAWYDRSHLRAEDGKIFGKLTDFLKLLEAMAKAPAGERGGSLTTRGLSQTDAYVRRMVQKGNAVLNLKAFAIHEKNELLIAQVYVVPHLDVPQAKYRSMPVYYVMSKKPFGALSLSSPGGDHKDVVRALKARHQVTMYGDEIRLAMSIFVGKDIASIRFDEKPTKRAQMARKSLVEQQRKKVQMNLIHYRTALLEAARKKGEKLIAEKVPFAQYRAASLLAGARANLLAVKRGFMPEFDPDKETIQEKCHFRQWLAIFDSHVIYKAPCRVSLVDTAKPFSGMSVAGQVMVRAKQFWQSYKGKEFYQLCDDHARKKFAVFNIDDAEVIRDTVNLWSGGVQYQRLVAFGEFYLRVGGTDYAFLLSRRESVNGKGSTRCSLEFLTAKKIDDEWRVTSDLGDVFFMDIWSASKIFWLREPVEFREFIKRAKNRQNLPKGFLDSLPNLTKSWKELGGAQ